MTSTPLSPAARALIERRAKEAVRQFNRIPKYAETDSAPLSFVQQMLWLSTQLDKTTTAYNRCTALRVVGSLDDDVLQRAISEIVRRHRILRSRVESSEGAPRFHTFPIDRIPLPVTDLSMIPREDRAARVRELLDTEARRPFDLDTGPWLRAGILREDDLTSTFYISTHHIASDGWSDAVMFRELHALYSAFVAGEPSPLPELTTEYFDFVAWQRERINGVEGDRNAAYWRERMRGAPVVQELPVDRPRSDLFTMTGGQVSLAIDADLARNLEAIGRDEGVTPAMTMLAAFLLWQSRITGQADAVTGLSLAGRTHSEVEGLIGLFNCIMPLRVTIDREMAFRDLLHMVRITSLEAHEHQDVSVDAILDSLQSAGGTRRAEIAQTMFNFRNMPEFEPSLPGLDVEVIETFNGSSVTDLELEVLEGSGGWECVLRFRTDLFDETTASRLLRHYLTLLESVAQSPGESCGRIQLLTEEERHQILVDFRGPVVKFPRVTGIHQLVSEQAAKTPTAVAVSAEGGEMTYRNLELKSNALAHDLIARGVEPGDLVGVCMERSLEMIVSLVAILKSGAAFVPFDLDYPIERLVHMLSDTKPTLLLADSRGASLLGSRGVDVTIVDRAYVDALDADAQPPAIHHDEAVVACVLYTSGSTGLPKGVLSTHRGIVNNLQTMQEVYALTADDCMLHQTSLGFDAAAWEIFWPLSVGARTFLARPGGQRDADYIIEVIADQRIATLGFAPSMLSVMLDKPAFTNSDQIARVLTYGEVLSPRVQENFFALMPKAELHNLYGPSETSIVVTRWKCERGDTRRSVPIGRAMANTEIYILDGGLEPTPVGVRGEIYIGGVCVSNGYHNRPELNAARFPAHPFRGDSGDRVYRSGDIARFGTDGVIEYIGRRDNQLKIRGVRVELEEIEAALERLPGVSESVVVAKTDGDGEHRLIAYVAVDDAALAPLELRRSLEKQLPPQFLPAQIIPLESLPHGPNGKIDRARLPDPSSVVAASSTEAEEPRTEIEQRLASIWTDLLHPSAFTVRDSFFELGGHSLLAVRMLQRFADETGEVVSLRSFYREPTIEAMARLVSRGAPAVTRDELPPLFKVRESPKGVPALFYINGQPTGGGRYARRLAPYFPDDQGLYVVPLPIISTPITVPGLATRIVDAIRTEQPKGPYLLGGNCFGATLAFEIAQQLRTAGEEVPLVALVHPDARAPMHVGFRAIRRVALLGGLPEEFHFAEFSGATNYLLRTLREVWREQRRSSPQQRRNRLMVGWSWMTGFVRKHARRPIALWSTLRSQMAREADELIQDQMRPDFHPVPEIDPAGNQRAHAEIAAHAQYMSDAWTAYTPQPYDGRVAIIWPVEGPANPPWKPKALWNRLTPSLDWHFVPGNHWSMLHEHFEHSARALGAAVRSGRKG